ncbi:MAG: YkgJ family cysteine cluster protein [Polyangiaceae bacterium]
MTAAAARSDAPSSGDAQLDREIPDCRTCGACCYGDEMWIHVMADDDERLGEDVVRRLTVLTQHGRGYVARSMKMEGGRCAAYRDKLADGKCGCSIHEIRPDICREFEAGTPDCHAARKRRGIE